MKALQAYGTFSQEGVDHLVKKASVAALNQHGELANLAVAETGRGVFEDKAVKNIFACEHVTHSMANMKTVGVISEDPITGITEIAEPVGVVCGVTPVTNPTSTAIFKSLIALKTRNPIIFAFHPSAQKSSVAAARIVRDAAVAAGAPEHCVQWIETPSIEATNLLMNHPRVAMILATGGNAMVHAAYSCGKPALGVGAGNVPAYVAADARGHEGPDGRGLLRDVVPGGPRRAHHRVGGQVTSGCRPDGQEAGLTSTGHRPPLARFRRPPDHELAAEVALPTACMARYWAVPSGRGSVITT